MTMTGKTKAAAKAAKAAAKAKANAAHNAKIAKGAKRTLAALSQVVNIKKVGTVATTPKGMQHAVFNADAKIVVLPAGKENPRREGTARWQRYRDLQNSKTVGEFLKKHPRWRATVTRCVIDKLIELR
jgi:hypothetical protein